MTDIERGGADHLHELLGRPQGVRRPPRRARCAPRRTPGPCSPGRSPSTAPTRSSCSSPISTSAATPATSSASPRPTWRCGTLEPSSAAWTSARSRRRTFLLWKGHCSVHQRFRPAHVEAWRAAHPGGVVLAHPECAHDVVTHGRSGRVHRRHHRRRGGSRRRHRHRHRHRDPPRRPPGRRAPRARHRLPRPAGLPVLDDVPRRRPPPVLGAREPGRGRGASTGSRVDDATAADARVALERMLAIT